MSTDIAGYSTYECYNCNVKATHFRSKIMTGRGSDLAFAVIVLSTYFFIFTSISLLSTIKIILLLILGVINLASGIYGYGFCVRNESRATSLIYMVSQIIVAACILFLTNPGRYSILLLLPLIVHSAILLTGFDNTITNVFISLTFTLAIYLNGNVTQLWENLALLVGAQLFIVNFIQMVINEESSRVEIEGLIKDLEVSNEVLRNYASQIEELTLANERNRMAREIHDGLGHYLTTIGMQVKAAQTVLQKNPEKALELLKNAEILSQDALKDVRHSVSATRLEYEEKIPFQQRLNGLLKPFENTGYTISYETLGSERPLPYESETLLFRIMQEGLSNIGRHSNGKEINIIMDYQEDDFVTLSIQDNGTGTHEIVEGNGIIGLRERVKNRNGAIEIKRTDKYFILKTKVATSL